MMKTYVLAYDLHFPVHDNESWAAVLDFVKNNRIDGFVFGGDQLDLAEVSHHTKSKPIHRPRGALLQNLLDFDRAILSKLEKLLPAGSERVWVTGNHERFLQDLLDEQPELEGMISIEEKLRLTGRGWKVIPLAGHHKVGNLHVIHGDQVGGGMHSAKKAVDTWCCSLAMGHHHTLQSFTKSSPAHLNQRWTATVLPCLSTTAPVYGRGRANTWQNGFGIVEVRAGGDFNLYPVIISSGQFSYGGRLYGRKRKKAA